MTPTMLRLTPHQVCGAQETQLQRATATQYSPTALLQQEPVPSRQLQLLQQPWPHMQRLIGGCAKVMGGVMRSATDQQPAPSASSLCPEEGLFPAASFKGAAVASAGGAAQA